jgi:fructosamine-3-kinase
MPLNEELKIAIEKQWAGTTGRRLQIDAAAAVYGGDISTCFRLTTSEGSLFLKYRAAAEGADFFRKELDGLNLLLATPAVRAPRPLFYGSTASGSYLVMEFLEKKTPRKHFWELLAGQLAALHRCTAACFGLGEDNFIGSLPQDNRPADSWPEFYASRRLEPLLRRLTDRGLLGGRPAAGAYRLLSRLADIFPDEKPALLHGDLWGGNFLSGPGGEPYLFDPAVHYGNREMDLAMTRLFGGFDRKFYQHYEALFPLAPEWEKRSRLCQLYPLLVHALLFGGGYVRQVTDILSAY